MLQQLLRVPSSACCNGQLACDAVIARDRLFKATRNRLRRATAFSHPTKAQRPPSHQSQQSYLITCHPGLEEVAAGELRQPWLQELHQLQDVEVIAPGRVTCRSNSITGGYAAALHLRSATRVLHLVSEETLNPNRPAGDTVYESTRDAVAWHDWLAPKQTFGIHCLHFYNNSNITNSQLVGRRIRDAICDSVRDARGTRPAPPECAPDLPIVFQMLNNKLQLFRDLGGGSLHRRGYRRASAVHKAALNEAAAAGLLLIAGWQDKCRTPGIVLADPMCGSATFLIEAALMATQTAPGLLRHDPWPFLRWHDSEEQQWKGILQAAKERQQQGRKQWRELRGQLLGNDLQQGPLRLASDAANLAGVGKVVRLSNNSCDQWIPKSLPNMVVANPPWGLRLLGGAEQQGYGNSRSQQRHRHQGGGFSGSRQEEMELQDAWQQLSVFLKQQCPGAEAWVLSGNPEVTQYLGMRSSKKRSISIGGMKTAWLKYEVRSSTAGAVNNDSQSKAKIVGSGV